MNRYRIGQRVLLNSAAVNCYKHVLGPSAGSYAPVSGVIAVVAARQSTGVRDLQFRPEMFAAGKVDVFYYVCISPRASGNYLWLPEEQLSPLGEYHPPEMWDVHVGALVETDGIFKDCGPLLVLQITGWVNEPQCLVVDCSTRKSFWIPCRQCFMTAASALVSQPRAN